MADGNQNIQTTKTSHTRVILVIAVMVLILIAAAIYFALRKKPSTGQTPQTANQIRNLFNVPTSTPFSAPPPTALNPKPPVQQQNPNPASGQNFYSQTPPAAASTAQNSSPQVLGNKTYQNGNFQISIPANWTAQENGNRTYFFDSTTGNQQGFIETYTNTGTTVQDVQQTLQNSPSVSQANVTSVNGINAVRFTAYNPALSGIALVTSNKIYYLYQKLSSQDILSGFRPSGGATANPPQNNPAPQNNPPPSNSGNGIIYY